jgi:hypothetical protein
LTPKSKWATNEIAAVAGFGRMSMAMNMNFARNLALKSAGLLCLATVLAVLTVASPAAAQLRASDEAAARSSRPRVVIQPRRQRLGPNTKRECRAKLVQEYRVSGTVIVPRMTCWWR